MEHKDHLIGDASYLATFHRLHLTRQKADGKKDVGHKQRVLCYLFSHIGACGLPRAQVALLRTLADVSSPYKAQMLMASVKEAVETGLAEQQRERGELAEEYAVLMLSSFDASACSVLNEPASPAWTVFLDAVRRCFQAGEQSKATVSLAQTDA